MKQLFTLAAAATILAACSINGGLDQTPPTATERVPLTIGYSMGTLTAPLPATRANTNDTQGSSILTSNKLGVFVLKKDQNTHTTTEAYERFNIGSSTLSANNPTTGYSLINISGTDALVYPENKTQEIDIYAYAPHNGSASVSNISSDLIAINTNTDQSTEANYMASDVLWGCAGTGTNIATAATASTGHPYEDLKGTGNNQANENPITAQWYLTIKKNVADPTTTPPYTPATADGRQDAYYLKLGTPNTADVVVPMLHRGSKIIVNVLASGMEKAKLQNAVVKFNVDYTAGSLNVATGEYKVPTATAVPSATTPITLTDHLGIAAQSATPTEEGSVTVSTTNDAYTCSAVIVPQTLTVTNDSGNGGIISIELKSDTTSSATTTATYIWKTGSTAPTFVSGKVYTYNITVKASGLSVTTTVSDWIDGQGGTPVAGNAELQ